jgi:hypothetical protein
MSDLASRHAARLADLKSKLATIAGAIAGLPERRRPHALAAIENDRAARTALEGLDSEAADLERQAELVTMAIEEAERLAHENEAEEAAAARADLDGRARKLCQAIAATQVEADQMMRQLAECLARRANMIHDLNKLRIVDVQMIFRLASREPTTSAAVSHGLNRFISTEPVPPASVRNLADSNRLLLGVAHV